MEAIANPRITCAYLNSYVGKSVIVVGKVIQLRGEEAIIDADGNITAHLNRVSCCFNPQYLFQYPSRPRRLGSLTPARVETKYLQISKGGTR